MWFRSRQRTSSPSRANFPPPYMSPTRLRASPSLSTTTRVPSPPALQPYLGLRARCSLAWLAYPILILFLIVIQLILSLQSVHDGVGDAKREMSAACSGVESAASVAVSIPHFMADQTNDFLVSGAENVVHGLAIVLDLSIRAIEAIVLYIIDTYRSLYLCLAEFVVRASLSLLIAAAEEAEKAFAEAVNGIRTAIQSTIGGAESLLKGAINDLNKIPLVHIQQPNLEVPDLTALQNVKLPTGLSDALTKLNSSLPTLSELKDSLDKIISTPFEAMRTEVTTNLRNATINRNLLKVPPRKTVQFCQDLDTSFIDDIGKIIIAGIKLIILAIVIVMVLIALFNVLKEKFMWKRMLTHVQRSRDAWLNTDVDSLSTPRLLAFLQYMQHPFVSRLFKKTPGENTSGRHRLPWVLAYLSWPSALMFLGAGLLGLLVVEAQVAALHGVRNRAVQQANAGVNDLSNILVNKINQETANASATFANDTNAVILGFESDVNNHMLGWAGTTTTTLNSTLNTFYDGLTTAVNDTFGSTPLRDPALELLNCLIGSKVAGIQTALTFVHDHAHVDLPTVSPTALMITPRQTQDLVGSIASAQNGSPEADQSVGQPTVATSFVDRLIDRYVKALEKQRLTYLALLGCYLVVMLFSAIGLIWDVVQARRTRNGPEKGAEFEEKSSQRGFQAPGRGLEFHRGSLEGADRKGNSLRLLSPLPAFGSPITSMIHTEPLNRQRSQSLESVINAQIGTAATDQAGGSIPTRSPVTSPVKSFYPTSAPTGGFRLRPRPNPEGYFSSSPIPPLNFSGPHRPAPPPPNILEPSEQPVSKFSPITPSPSPASKWPGE